MRLVSVCIALRKAGTRRAVANRREVSGLKVLKAAMISSSDGMSPVLGPSVGPGIRQLLDDLASTLGPERLILAYLDDIYILSNAPNALEEVQVFFSARQPSIQLNMAKSKTIALQEARERMQLLDSCIGPTATCAPLSYAAASEASDAPLATLLDQDIDTANQTVLSQRERCQAAFLSTRDSLLESLDPQSAKSVIEACSLLGRNWLSVISFSPTLRLTDFEVTAALHARTLLPGASTHCRHCGAPNQLGHDEICHRRAPWTVARHEQAKQAIGQALATVEGVQVHLEPLITGTQRWNDIRITGSAASGLSSEDIDIIIVSLASQDSQTATLPLATTEDHSAAERTTKLVEKHNAVGREKRRLHPPTDQSFRPFVLSLGGMMETDARDALKLWKSIMTGELTLCSLGGSPSAC
ncbi:hypothetical protein JCM24511_02104 [Saitozyma sp. JCM 24511]|nr:hypothetical protein JCM24511_02104 [Saitozyma sp. JCM 24511]